jgi:ribonuclease P protein component
MLKKTVLRRKNDFSAIYNKGKSVGERYIVLFYKRNDLPYNRIAFLASKKVGKSVERNRARRLMKESYRELAESQTIKAVGYDFILIARNTINNLKCADVKKSIEAAMRKAGALEKKVEEGVDA